jgi:F0F1-type ATP synthase assembly protein I
MPKPKSKPVAAAAPEKRDFSGAEVGINLLVSVLVAGALGYGLDRWLGWAPWGMLGGGALGFAAWLRTVWRLMRTA